MAAYKFYYVSKKGNRYLAGILPERRHDPKRITHQSIMNWWRKVAGHAPMEKGHRIHFEQVKSNLSFYALAPTPLASSKLSP